jgi:transcriptional regulator with XRE-family HTH domain
MPNPNVSIVKANVRVLKVSVSPAAPPPALSHLGIICATLPLVLHEEVREARIAAKLTQSALARLSGVPRKQVRALEEGANVTLATVRKIVAVLPNLKSVTLGGLTVRTESADLEAARRAAAAVYAAARALVKALGAEREVAEMAPPASSGATRFDGGNEVSRKLLDKLEQVVDEIRKSRGKLDS